MKPKTIQNIHMNVRAALSQAVKLDLIKKNPAENVTLPKNRKYKAEIYDQDEVAILIEKVKDTDLEVSISLAVGLGLRRGELLVGQRDMGQRDRFVVPEIKIYYI